MAKILVIIALIASLAGAVWGIYHKGFSAGSNYAQVATERATQAQIAKLHAQLTKLRARSSKLLVKAKAREATSLATYRTTVNAEIKNVPQAESWFYTPVPIGIVNAIWVRGGPAAPATGLPHRLEPGPHRGAAAAPRGSSH